MNIQVLGGGISGLTTAIVLQSLGLEVEILSEHLPNACAPDHSEIATSYAMASAYPHNLRVRNLTQISDDSQSIFHHLHSENSTGVELQEIFEVYEMEPEPAPLGERRIDMQYFDGTPSQLKTKINPPIRAGAEYLWGCKFKSYFADMPVYLRYLWNLFKDRGGILTTTKITKDKKGSRDNILINCLGVKALEFTGDSSPNRILRGKQILVEGAPQLLNDEKFPVAYNYTPHIDIFPRGDGNPEYVHFFARSDGWLLGQTREPGFLNENGEWEGIVSPVQTVDVDGISIPKPIIDLNSELLESWFGARIDKHNLKAREGLRFYRDPLDSGVRLEAEFADDTFMVHNYGHGGSGITMSWGCAIEAARLVAQQLKPRVNRGGTALDRILQNSLAAGCN